MKLTKLFWIGLTITTSIVIFVFGLMYLQDISLNQPSMTFTVIFDNVQGLNEGDDVNMLGKTIGKVRATRIDAKEIAVEIGIYQDFSFNIPIDSADKKIVYDHDHETCEFRGWLCDPCNRGLGQCGDNIDGLVISNSTIERPDTLKSNLKNEIGGLSGKPLFLKSTMILRKMYTLTNGQIPLIGVGGINNALECYEKIKSGASLVQLYSALTFEGPKIINKILIDLSNLLKTDGYKSIKEAIGKDT